MSAPIFVEDGNVLWILITKVGDPDMWQSGKNYRKGDIVVPTIIGPGQDTIAFQCIGFVGGSGLDEPTWTTTADDIIEDGNSARWKADAKDQSPAELGKDQYYLINETVTVQA